MINDIFPLIRNNKHWDQQINLLQQIQYTQRNIKQLNINKNVEIIKTLFTNPRSKMIISLTQFLMDVFDNHGSLVHNLALNLFNSAIIFKILKSNNKVISNAMHQLMKSMVVNCPHSKYYTIFAHQFNNCKNSIVREYISTYLLVLADTVVCPNNMLGLMKYWENDSSANVRKNIKLLRQIIQNSCIAHHQQSIQGTQQQKVRKPLKNCQNLLSSFQLKQKEQNKHNNKQSYQNQQRSQIIADSFLYGDSFSNIQQDIQFLIYKIKSNQQIWSAKFMAIQQLCYMIDHDKVSQQYYHQIIQLLVNYLDTKKNKVNQLCFKTLLNLISHHRKYFIEYAHNNSQIIIKKCLSCEQIAKQLLKELIVINANKYLVLLTQSTLEIKSIKSKALLLDILADAYCQQTIQENRVSTVTKIICQIFGKFSHIRQIYMPCMVIFTHLRSLYPQQLLATLMIQNTQTLKKLIQIAQKIDPELREGILDYLRYLKNNQQLPSKQIKKLNHSKNTSKKQQQFTNHFNIDNSSIINQEESITHNQQQILHNDDKIFDIQFYLKQIRQEKVQNAVQNLAKNVFYFFKELNITNFLDIIKLTENLTSQALMLDLQLFLEELCQIQSVQYLNALFLSIQQCNLNSIEKQYIVSYLQKIAKIAEQFSDIIEIEHADRLLKMYRASKCSKLRMSCIKVLINIHQDIYQDIITEKQKELINTYKNKQKNKLSLVH